jgi:glycosyltransferase involved in cell wall biosynthesis
VKVCIVGSVNVPIPRVSYGGIEEYVFRVSVELVKIGCEVHILTVGGGKSLITKIVNGVHIHEITRTSLPNSNISVRASRRLMFGHQVYQVAKKIGGFDVLHLNVGYSGWEIVLKKSKFPVIFTAHNAFPWLANWSSLDTLNYFERFYRDFDDILTNFVAKRSNRVIAISSHMSNAVMRKGIKGDKLNVIFNAVDTEKFHPILNAREYFLKTYCVPDNKVLFLFLGGLRIEKGVDYLLLAFKELCKYHHNVFLVIAGEGNYRTNLESLVKNLKINNVKFLGSILEDHLPIIYSACDVYVLPSILEPFGLTILEAMASGKPVIITSENGKDIIEDGKQGFLVPPRDALKIFEAMSKCMDELARKKMGSAALARAKTFTWKETAKRLLKTYYELC